VQPLQENPGLFGTVLGPVMNLIANPNMHVPHDGILLKENVTTEDLLAAANSFSRPTTVVTPESGVVSVGPSGPVTPGARPGARGEQTVTVGGAEQKKPDQNRKNKKGNEKKKP
jgi:hypothetical protein